jgi:hypothetical protein
MPSLDFYTRSGDELSVATIQFYLAYLHRQTEPMESARHYLRAALGWLAGRNVYYFPLWWHPQMVLSICTFALEEDIFSVVAERILTRFIGKKGLEAVSILCLHEDAAVRQRAESVREFIDDSLVIDLSHIQDERTRRVVESLLAEGTLRRDDMFAHLQAKLTTAHQRHTPNPGLVAIFGLYLKGHSSEEIANRLSRARSSVRNAITTIYQIFDIPQSDGTPGERKQRVVEIAVALGYLSQPHKKS